MIYDASELVNIMALIAVSVFAISGALDAARQRMDILGLILIGTVTGLGGGTLRDLLMGNLPVFWIKEPIWVATCLLSSAATYWIAPLLASLTRTLIWMDAIGLALFTIIGTKLALDVGTTPLIAICMGVMTASFGGIARDVLCGSNLTLMKEELYITPTVIGASVYYWLNTLALMNNIDLIGGFSTVFILRATGIQFNLKLPNHNR